MAQQIRLKRSAVTGKTPLTTDVALGELAINTFDGKMFFKRNNGTESIIELSNVGHTHALGTLTGVVLTSPSTNQVLQFNGTNWVNATIAGSGTVTSVALSGGTTGLTVTGSPITTSGTLTLGGTLNNSATTATSANTASAIVARDASGNFSAGTITATSVTGSGATLLNPTYQAAINTTTPGTGTYGLHFSGQSTADFASGITWNGGSTGGQAGIYVQGGSSYGTRMYLATTDVYATGAKTAISISNAGLVNFVRSRPTALGNVMLDAGNYNSYSPTLTGTGASGTWGINITGTAPTLQTARTINGTSFNGSANITTNSWGTSRTLSFTGDVTGSSAVDGSANVATAMTLANSGVTEGTHTKVTVDAKGRVTAGTTLAATDIPNLDAAKITSGVFDQARLPSYVDDVLEYTNLASFPVTGETGKIYVDLTTNKTYRWSGSTYIYITSGAVDSVAGKTGVVTLNKNDVGLGNVDNTADANKNVATAATWTTARTISLGGNLSGSASVNGSANATITATINNSTITASKLDGSQTGSAPIFGVRAYVVYNGSNASGTNSTILAHGNVASVYKTGTYTTRLTFSTPLPHANYAVVGAASFFNSGAYNAPTIRVSSASTTQVEYVFVRGDGNAENSTRCSVMIIG